MQVRQSTMHDFLYPSSRATGMPIFPVHTDGSIHEAVKASILEVMPDANVDVQGGGGHFSIGVVSSAFEGLNRVKQQRLVLGAIAHLMAGDSAPVHAVDTLKTVTK
ncbi:MAG: acid stress-induced BolA-like protein IbaG/YrbA [Bradymonadia bacterium]|jgi:acid stress-induced BolA-like protein IbaG/YrbA